MALRPRSESSSGSTRNPSIADDRQYTERNVVPVRTLNDRTPLMDHAQNISREALRALSYILVASIILTLSGLCLIFFTEDIREVLWQSIVLIILGTTATVITVLPGSGPYIVEHWKNVKCSHVICWRHWTCSDFCNGCSAREDVLELNA